MWAIPAVRRASRSCLLPVGGCSTLTETGTSAESGLTQLERDFDLSVMGGALVMHKKPNRSLRRIRAPHRFQMGNGCPCRGNDGGFESHREVTRPAASFLLFVARAGVH